MPGNKILKYLLLGIGSLVVCGVTIFESVNMYTLIPIGAYILDILYVVYLVSLILVNKGKINKKTNFIISIIFTIFSIVMILDAIYGNIKSIDETKEIRESTRQLSSQEIQAINSNFENYTGKQSGSKVKGLITYSIANAKTYEDEPERLPTIFINGVEFEDVSLSKIKFETDIDSTEALKKYVNSLEIVYKKIDLQHTYRVIFSKADNGLINQIDINYDVDNFNTNVED